MRTSIRIALLACIAFAGLVFSGSALAAYTPKLVVHPGSQGIAGAGATALSIAQAATDDPTAHITIYVPLGYSVSLSQAAGTNVGTVDARSQAADLGNAELPLSGPVVADDPTKYATNATQCTGSPTHEAVWVANLTAAGQTIAVPLYVDHVSGGPEAQFAQAKIQVCFSPPDIPAGTPGRAPFGAKVLSATLTINGVFTNPAAAGQFTWAAVFTPYVPGKGAANAAGTVESRAIVALPVQLTLTGKYQRRNHSVILVGQLTANRQPVSGARVTVMAGKTARSMKAIGTAKTSSTGTYGGVLTRLKTTKKPYFLYFRSRVTAADRDVTSAGCAGTSLAPAGCVSATQAGFSIFSRTIIRVRITR